MVKLLQILGYGAEGQGFDLSFGLLVYTVDIFYIDGILYIDPEFQST